MGCTLKVGYYFNFCCVVYYCHQTLLQLHAPGAQTKEKRASTSLLQRKLNIGYSRAARLADQLEAIGAISPQDGSKSREVLITTIDEAQEKIAELNLIS